jgi:hypothetical protein
MASSGGSKSPKKPQKRGRGRPPGKKSDPNYTQVMGYIRKDTYRALKIRCAQDDVEISQVLQQLLDAWLNS